MYRKAGRVAVVVFLALSIAAILWLTLFSRLGSELRQLYPPFWSYRAIAGGNRKVFLEVIGNIILFIPIGVTATLIFRLNLWKAIVVGFFFSLIIESCQWFFWLGSFEVDDLAHNTLGAAFGVVLVRRAPSFQNRKRNTMILLSLIVLTILSGFVFRGLKVRSMVRYAAMNDRADGTRNLLVLSPDLKYVGQSGFNISFNSDGSIRMVGKAEKRAWIEIGRVTLQAGGYIFTGFSGVPEKTIGIELEYFDMAQGKYVRLTPDIGSIDMTKFVLEKDTKVRALIGLYAGAEGDYLARPAIYREE